jgi:hypothetical protein
MYAAGVCICGVDMHRTFGIRCMHRTDALLGRSLDTPWCKYGRTQCLIKQSYPPTNVRKRGNLGTVLIDGFIISNNLLQALGYWSVAVHNKF